MGSETVKTCERIAAHDLLANTITIDDIQTAPKQDTNCTAQTGQAAALQKHLEIFSAYATQLVRAAKGLPPDYNLGSTTEILSNAKIIGVGGKSDKDDITKIGNAVAQFFSRQNRARLIRDTILDNNAQVQEAAKYFEAAMVSDWCNLKTINQHKAPVGYCAIFSYEMEHLQHAYCIVGKRIFKGQDCQVGSNNIAIIPSVIPSPLPTPVPDPSESPAPPDDCAVDVLRQRLRDGIYLPTESAPAPSTPRPPNGSGVVTYTTAA